MSFVQVKELYKSYSSDHEKENYVLKNISFQIEENEFVCVLGRRPVWQRGERCLLRKGSDSPTQRASHLAGVHSQGVSSLVWCGLPRKP